jgi:hypothetical protein
MARRNPTNTDPRNAESPQCNEEKSMTDNMTTDDLLNAMQEAATWRSREGVLEMAKCYAELRRRRELSHPTAGGQFRGVRGKFFPLLQEVANGKLLAEVLFRFFGCLSFVELFVGVDMADQAKLAMDGASVAFLDHHGMVKQVRVAGMRVVDLRQVIGGGRIRTPVQQKRHLAPPPAPYRPRKPAVEPIAAAA